MAWPSRLQRSVKYLKKHWRQFLLSSPFVIWGLIKKAVSPLLEDRVIGAVNAFVDRRASGFWESVRPALLFAIEHPWLILVLFVVMLIGHAYWSSGATNRTADSLPDDKTDEVMPEHRPRIFPVSYEKNEQNGRFGLFLRNPGYDALEVHIPSVQVRPSAYMLTFPQQLSLLSERDGKGFLEGWLEDQTNTLPGRDGGSLHEVMRKSDIDAVEFSVHYKDTDFREFRTKCIIERTNRTRSGLQVRALKQELIRHKTETTRSELVITPTDPLIYLNAIEIRHDDFSSSTAFVLENRGGSVAHLIHIARGETRFGYRKVRFAPKDNLAVGKPTEIFPLIDNTRTGLKNDIIPVLLEEINARGSAEGTFVENLGFSFVISHQSFDQKTFEVSVDVNFKSIRYLYRSRHPNLAKNDPEEIFQITHSGFKRLS
jgi:hypothetical protein